MYPLSAPLGDAPASVSLSSANAGNDNGFLKQPDLAAGDENSGSWSSVRERLTWPAIKKGLKCRCPKCGRGKLFRRYLQPVENCSICGEPFGDRHQAGLLLPFIVITILGHLLAFGLVELSRLEINPGMSLAILLPLTVIVSLILLPPTKGALIGALWSRNLSDEQR